MTAQVVDPPANGAFESPQTGEQPAHWGAIFALTLCVFALIASEFMPVSLLTLIASDLHISEGLVGYGIAISGAFAVLTSLNISAVVDCAGLDRGRAVVRWQWLPGHIPGERRVAGGCCAPGVYHLQKPGLTGSVHLQVRGGLIMTLGVRQLG